MNGRIIIVDDDLDYLDVLRRTLQDAGYRNIVTEDDPRRAATCFANGEGFDAALIDLHMPGMDGFELLQTIKALSGDTECIMITAVNDAQVAARCMRHGAYDYLVKPVQRHDLLLTLERARERKRLLDIVGLGRHPMPAPPSPSSPFSAIVTACGAMQRLLREAELHAASNVPILITGESGTGKNLLARAIHEASRRSDGPFLAINMAAVSPTLFDAEFFGHTRGAFTGAVHNRAGHLEAAQHGTLFLDEIGNLPIDLQGKLLHVLEEGGYLKLGTSSRKSVDVRVIAATNADIDKLVNTGRFRQDLYYRIRGSWLHLPPLRQRSGDVEVLTARFLPSGQGSPGGAAISADALTALTAYAFPGNVRELKTCVETAVNLAQGRRIGRRHLPSQIRASRRRRSVAPAAADQGLLPLAHVEREHILAVYRKTGGNKARSARILGVGLNTLRRRLNAYGVD